MMTQTFLMFIVILEQPGSCAPTVDYSLNDFKTANSIQYICDVSVQSYKVQTGPKIRKYVFYAAT